ncbi:sugar ABC transporter ATP-binding protein [Pseudohalocynthiibacter aestuariivivens]|uniref:Sugar ABC transporter ATP-binding protein n=1 Tax=Pseudohalocynthiibacter aestuariivivens TaxID=1591409 RepID=A0ABV5JEE7_9RHOB|nr:sugar ABC transporter ATP-binding protein [Pseudohalocynthiibacter aestuariivivens]MBS9718804.1 sugar ABC transporter ATP-binding protein [Pseudohalocynthiibacter aestuariivivens]
MTTNTTLNPPTATGQSSAANAPLIDMKGIQKRFPGVLALDQIEFELRPGEVHVLFGENGAGKSTLINVISGTFPQDGGTYTFCGEALSNLNPYRARQIGISPVFQEFSLAPDLTIEENLFLGREISKGGVLNKSEMRTKVAQVLDNLGFDLSAKQRVAELSRAQQQMAEIAKALLHDVRVLILDEPTASLSERETERLFEIIDDLKAQGVGIIYVSHRMAEIKRLADRVTVLRDGRLVGTVEAELVSEEKLIEMMTGRTFEAMFPHIENRAGDTLLQTSGLTTRDRLVDNVDFNVKAGEVVGIAGLVGCGKSELARAIFGLEDIESGKIELMGQPVTRPSPAHMLKRGLCYFPSDRVAEGLALPRSVRENMTLAALDLKAFASRGFLKIKSERRIADEMIRRLTVAPGDPEKRVEFLSGGNRQKVMLARGLERDVKVYLFDEPTVGIDVGAKAEIYNLIKEMAEGGAAVVVISSELPEVIHLSHRAYVMHRGALVAELTGEEIVEATILAHFFDRDHLDEAGEPPLQDAG